VSIRERSSFRCCGVTRSWVGLHRPDRPLGHGCALLEARQRESRYGAETRSGWKGRKHRQTPHQRSRAGGQATQCAHGTDNRWSSKALWALLAKRRGAQRKSDRYGLRRRAPREVFTNGRASGQEDLLRERDGADGELRLADNLGLARGTCAAAEVHTQVAVPVFVRALAQCVCRINGSTCDQGAGRRDGDQLTETAAQWTTSRLGASRVAVGHRLSNRCVPRLVGTASLPMSPWEICEGNLTFVPDSELVLGRDAAGHGSFQDSLRRQLERSRSFNKEDGDGG
jgi:hypothetical protein